MSSITLNIDDITLLDKPISKREAISQVAQKMIAGGLVKDDYEQAMFDRDAQISTYLGNGIAIPHGTTEKRDSVLNTGLKVLYSKEGITWDDDETAHIVIGIAAKSNEHLNILRQLTRVVIDESALTKIKAITTSQQLLALLTGQEEEPVLETHNQISGDVEFTVKIYNPHGLHTRPAAAFVKEIKPFESDIQVADLDGSGEFINAKSMMKLVSLGVKPLNTLKFVITGSDAKQAADTIKRIIDEGLGEDISSLKPES
ncbi:HPr family phosphocarrier protein [Zophobihabitans entericus]|uniref:Multiphosphoryl transfer protein n=1 Tax=Zophobihabitans entericus TaxID=1635327 RepID=A0A6G9IC93_9GAMM|nr:HPr family phosphocarrier protein [Zophobihabitans entericus]QIQ21851.1 HPr family phosphocarrier protein [Zophobihabitans entericus]